MTFAPHAPTFAPGLASARRHRARGFSLVELLVSLLIGLILTLAMSSALIVGEGHKRTTGSVTEMDQSGAYTASMMDVLLRNAGSGLMQSSAASAGVLGCHLNAGSALPANSLPAPFDGLLGGHSNLLRVAPVLIAKDQSGAGSDVLVVMGGSGAAGGISRQQVSSGSSTSLNLANTVGIQVGDLVLLSSAGSSDCIIEPVSAKSDTMLTLEGTLYAPGPGNLAGMLSNSGAYVTPLGSLAAGDVQFQLLGVGDKDMLYSYDLLNAANASPNPAQAVASNVHALHALYGVDTAGDGKLHAWVDPGAGGFEIGALMNDPAKLRQIVAIRVALVLKSSLYEKEPIAAAAPAWFDGALDVAGVTGAQRQTLEIDPKSSDAHYRYRVVEFVVPLRNNLISQS